MKFTPLMLAMAVIAGGTQIAMGQAAAERARAQHRRDQLRMAVQEVCPVTGEMLGSMGAPLKVKVGEEMVFLCCKGCLQQKIKPEHWAKIHVNFAKAQRICPVMKHELPKNPEWTIVEGQIVFVCCPPCTKKIAADPQEYLSEVDQLYAASLDARTKTR